MGTNYYAIKKPTKELKNQIIGAVEDDKWDIVISLTPKQIHIGKSSVGWQFIFDHQEWEYFDKSKESIKEFLSQCLITDEYGRDITNDDFWVMVANKEKYKADLVYGQTIDGLSFSNGIDFS